MTTRRNKPRATATVENKDKVEEVKPVEETVQPEEQKPKPKPRRPRAKPATVAEKPKEDVKVPPVDDETEDFVLPDTPIETDPEEIDPRMDDSTTAVIMSEIDRAQDQELNGKRSLANFKVGADLKALTKLTDQKVNYYPCMLWERDPRTLEQMAVLNIRKAEANGGELDTNGENIIALQEMHTSVSQDRHFNTFYNREGASWQPYLMKGEERIRPTRLNFATKKHGSTITERTDDQLLALLSRRLELGTPITVRLWHSGLIFAINPISKEASIDMLDRLNNAHLEVLRRTSGIIHGATSYYANRIIIQQFMKLVIDSNIDKNNFVDIYRLIDHRDIQVMAWGLFAASYQRGYNFIHLCGNVTEAKNGAGEVERHPDGEPVKTVCGHRTESIIDTMLLIQLDQSSFSDWQIDFIGKKITDTKETIEDIEKYQRLGRMHERSMVEIAEGIQIAIKSPKADRHIRIGEEWLSTVERSVDDVLRSDADEETRNNMIQNRMYVTNNMDVGHWVDAIYIDGEETNDEEFISRMLRTFGNNEQIMLKVHEEIRKAIATRIAAVAALPTHRCPSCKKLSSEIEGKGNAIYTPIDMVSRFFTLAARNL